MRIRSIDLDYDPEGNLTQIRHSGGYRIDVDTSKGLITALRLRGGDNGTDVTLIRYRYNTARRLTEVINSSDLPMRFDYDTEGRMTRWIDRNDLWYTFTYDAQGRVILRQWVSVGSVRPVYYRAQGIGGETLSLK